MQKAEKRLQLKGKETSIGERSSLGGSTVKAQKGTANSKSMVVTNAGRSKNPGVPKPITQGTAASYESGPNYQVAAQLKSASAHDWESDPECMVVQSTSMSSKLSQASAPLKSMESRISGRARKPSLLLQEAAFSANKADKETASLTSHIHVPLSALPPAQKVSKTQAIASIHSQFSCPIDVHKSQPSSILPKKSNFDITKATSSHTAPGSSQPKSISGDGSLKRRLNSLQSVSQSKPKRSCAR